MTTSKNSPIARVLASIGSVGDAYDNAMAESFKTELITDRVWRTRTQLELAVVEYVAWFNSARLHSSLGYQTPDEIETAWRQMPEPLLAQAASTPAFDGTAACGLAGTSGPIHAD
jgi:transposase InsO family protein